MIVLTEQQRKTTRRRVFLGFLLLEFLMFTGPFVIAHLHLAWCAWRGVPPPTRFAYVPWMFVAGLSVLVAWIVYDCVQRLRRRA